MLIAKSRHEIVLHVSKMSSDGGEIEQEDGSSGDGQQNDRTAAYHFG